jgi:hypothetical protein
VDGNIRRRKISTVDNRCWRPWLTTRRLILLITWMVRGLLWDYGTAIDAWVTATVKLAVEYLQYDPNYSYDDDDEMVGSAYTHLGLSLIIFIRMMMTMMNLEAMMMRKITAMMMTPRGRYTLHAPCCCCYCSPSLLP